MAAAILSREDSNLSRSEIIKIVMNNFSIINPAAGRYEYFCYSCAASHKIVAANWTLADKIQIKEQIYWNMCNPISIFVLLILTIIVFSIYIDIYIHCV